MTDQQELANIKNTLIPMIHTLNLDPEIQKMIVKDIRFLTELALCLENALKRSKEMDKRIKQLEMKYENTGAIFGRQNLQTRIGELTKALAFYAVEKNYESPYLFEGDNGLPVHDYSLVDLDQGSIARKALEGNA